MHSHNIAVLLDTPWPFHGKGSHTPEIDKDQVCSCSRPPAHVVQKDDSDAVFKKAFISQNENTMEISGGSLHRYKEISMMH
jgi:hypothetical protein